jgi:hypothetical protein
MIWKGVLGSRIIFLRTVLPLPSGSIEEGLSSNRAGFCMFPLIWWCWTRKLPEGTPNHGCWGPCIPHIISFDFIRREGWGSHEGKSAPSLADVWHGSPAFRHVTSVYTVSYYSSRRKQFTTTSHIAVCLLLAQTTLLCSIYWTCRIELCKLLQFFQLVLNYWSWVTSCLYQCSAGCP